MHLSIEALKRTSYFSGNDSGDAMNRKVPGDGEGLSYLFTAGQNKTVPGTTWEDNAGVGHSRLKWCTLDCEFADWPKSNIDGAKSCRTFNALYCNKLNEHVTRNTPCAAEHGQRRPKPNW